MLETVFATFTGASSANTFVPTLSRWLPVKLRYGIDTATKFPGSGGKPPAPSVQSLNFALKIVS